MSLSPSPKPNLRTFFRVLRNMFAYWPHWAFKRGCGVDKVRKGSAASPFLKVTVLHHFPWAEALYMRRSEPSLNRPVPNSVVRQIPSCREAAGLPSIVLSRLTRQLWRQEKLQSCNLIARKSTDHNMCSAMLRLSTHVVYGHGLR